jgi:predicted ester cyclase
LNHPDLYWRNSRPRFGHPLHSAAFYRKKQLAMSHLTADFARRWFNEVWNQRRPTAIDEMMSPDCVGHMEGRRIQGPSEFKAIQREFLAAFPDIRIEVKHVLADGELAAIRWAASASHTGDAFGIKATRKPVKFYGTTWLKCRDGRIVEGWDTGNLGDLLGQLRTPAQ